MNRTDERCENCKYFYSEYRHQETVGHRWFGFVEIYTEAGVVTGCRRRLPIVRTGRTDWCGEYESKQPADGSPQKEQPE